MTTSLFIGRWQVPSLHAGHRALIDTALAEGHHVVVAIRDTPLSADNPYPVYKRDEMIRGVYGDRVQVVTFPNPCNKLEVCYGRDVGYTFRRIDLPPDIEAISGTTIRAAKRRIVKP